MAKTYTAKSIRLQSLSFDLDDAERVIGLTVRAEVNFGEMGTSETVSLWPELSIGQQNQVQVLYNRVKAIVQDKFLA